MTVNFFTGKKSFFSVYTEQQTEKFKDQQNGRELEQTDGQIK